jgi:hypothetical protein
LILSATTGIADGYRIATFAAPLSRDGPGLLLRDILAGDPQIDAIAAVVAQTAPDVLILTDFDYDLTLAALTAFADLLARSGQTYPFAFARRPNSGMASGIDLDGDGRSGDARDAQGFGRFAGDGGMAILSKLPIAEAEVQDFSALLWRDLPGATLPEQGGEPFPSAAALEVQRLSTTAHWVVPLTPPDAAPFSLLAFSATPPVFDGPEDRNGLRNRDELRFWQVYLDGGFDLPAGSFVLAGNANLDPMDGGGLHAAMVTLLGDPRLIDPLARSAGAAEAAESHQRGDAGLDTADWPDDMPGNLRVSYVLPSAEWTVTGAGVFWPAPDDPLAALLGSDGLAAGPHHLVWVDISR